MKKLTKAILGAGAASLALGSTYVSAYDSAGFDHDMTAARSYHHNRVFVPPELCSGLCETLGGDGSSTQIIIEVENQWFIDNAGTTSLNVPAVGTSTYKSPGTGSGLASPLVSAEVAANGSISAASIAAAGIAAPATGSGQVLVLAQASSSIDALNQNPGVTTVGLTASNIRISGPYAWDFTTNAEGKIIDGGVLLFTDFFGSPVTQYQSLSNDWAIGSDTCTTQPDITAYEAASDSLNGQTQDDLIASGATLLVNDGTNSCTMNGFSEMDYLTCDPSHGCDGLPNDKTVPVPAFAAATLGLGLFGITLLTGRRRTIK